MRITLFGKERHADKHCSREVLVPREAIWMGLGLSRVLARLVRVRCVLWPLRAGGHLSERICAPRRVHRVRIGAHARNGAHLLEEGRAAALALGPRLIATVPSRKPPT